MRISTKLAGALAAGIAAVAIAAPAAASPADDATFLSLVSNNGLEFGSADIAIRQGKAVCLVLDRGYSLATAVDGVDSVLPVNHDGAVTVVAAAVVAYCPWHMPASSPAPSTTL